MAVVIGGRGFGFSEVVEHHGGAPDLADGVGDAFAGDVRGGAVDRFEEAGELAVRG